MQDMHYSSSQITVILFAPCLITYIKILIAPGGGVGMVWVSEQAKKKNLTDNQVETLTFSTACVSARWFYSGSCVCGL